MKIVQELNKLQHRHGYLRKQDMHALAEKIREPLYRLHEVASFFPHYRIEDPPPKVEVTVCRDMACHRNGSLKILEKLQSLAEGYGEKDIVVEGVSCLGRCDRGPCSFVASGHPHEERIYCRLDEEKLISVVKDTLGGAPPAPHLDEENKTDRTTWRIDPYFGEASPHEEKYAAVREFVAPYKDKDGEERQRIKSEQRDRVLNSLKQAGLLGMGGAGGRAFKKWNDVFLAAGAQKYIVCNCDESEPGTFKDREIILQCPHLVLEGMIMAALVTGADHGWVYIRHEYEEQVRAVDAAVKEAYDLGILGEDVAGSGETIHLASFTSPGGYICGEATALIQAMESKRGEPRTRPPELQTNGLFDKPTVVNNVETFGWVPAILLEEGGDGKWYAGQGTNKATGRRFFSISGDLNKPGVFEVPAGITLRELIEKAGGVRDGQKLKAVSLSGPSGGLLPAMIPAAGVRDKFQGQMDDCDRNLEILKGKLAEAIEKNDERSKTGIESHMKRVEGQKKTVNNIMMEKVPPGKDFLNVLDLELDVVRFRLLSFFLGGGMVIYGDGCDVVREALANLRFFRNESCGKCVPCRVGSQKMVEIAEELVNKKLSREQLNQKASLANDVGETMIATAICGLGTVAPNPLTSLLKYFDDDVSRYLRNGS